jgi:hypothetical protein
LSENEIKEKECDDIVNCDEPSVEWIQNKGQNDVVKMATDAENRCHCYGIHQLFDAFRVFLLHSWVAAFPVLPEMFQIPVTDAD